MSETIMELQVQGEPVVRGDALTWAMAIYGVLTEDQQEIVRNEVRTVTARMNRSRGISPER